MPAIRIVRWSNSYFACLLLGAACSRASHPAEATQPQVTLSDSAVRTTNDDATSEPAVGEDASSAHAASSSPDTGTPRDGGTDRNRGPESERGPEAGANSPRDSGAPGVVDAIHAPALSITVYPPSSSIALGAKQKFSATVTGTSDTRISWEVEETTGCGSIDNGGTYSGPPSSAVSACHVKATLQSDASVSGSATIFLVSASGTAQGCAAEPLRSTGQIHYVCDCQTGADSKCVAGNDSNNGLESSSPLQSFSKAASVFGSLRAGDTVAFCRGGRWNLSKGSGFSNSGCQKTNTCDVRDYGPPWADGSEAKPSIWLNGGSGGSTLMTFIHAAQHFEGYRVLNLDLHGTGKDNGLFFYNETTDVDLCNLTMDGFATSVQMGGGDSPAFGVQSNIVLRGSRVTNNTDIAYLATCDFCAVEDNYFDNNGVRSATTHTIYFASQAYKVGGQWVVHTSHGLRLARNEIHHSAQQCLGAPVVVHGRHEDVVIENNVIDASSAADDCWGPGVGCGGYGYGCWFRNTVIRGNTFRNLGNVGTDNSQCTGCTIENNLFVMNRGGTAVTLGGTKPRPAGDSTYNEWDGAVDDSTNNAIVRNNTFYLADASTAASAIEVFSGTGHVIENNAIMFAGGKSSSDACYRLPSNPATVLASADYNVCNITAGVGWLSYPPKYGTSLADWQAAGFEKHGQQRDPMFSNAPASFLPAKVSPLVNAGDAGQSPTDDLTHKQRDSQPDIGAFEL